MKDNQDTHPSSQRGTVQFYDPPLFDFPTETPPFYSMRR